MKIGVSVLVLSIVWVGLVIRHLTISISVIASQSGGWVETVYAQFGPVPKFRLGEASNPMVKPTALPKIVG